MKKEKDRLAEYLTSEFYDHLYKAEFEHCEALLESAIDAGIDVADLEAELNAWMPKEHPEPEMYD